MTQTQILIVEDDPKVRNVLSRCLKGEGFAVVEAEDEPQALALAKCTSFDLMTLDINLGEDDGFSLARKIRQFSQVPIIMVTGKDDVIDRVVGLELGADDYITKPFHLRELIARVKSVLRRTKPSNPDIDTKRVSDADHATKPVDGAFHFDGMTAFPDRFELFDRDGQPCELTSGEFKLLNVFIQRPKRILSREQLMDLIGGPDWTPLDRTIDNQIARLRKKVERDASNPKLITTVRGVGYSFTCDIARLDHHGPSSADTQSKP
ncbi:response regulator transcription factor [Rhodobacteraceae bacterium KMM 6894]|nr:response regulator transcription factor [Rhodobacteraceae bacterium KMM 6894]